MCVLTVVSLECMLSFVLLSRAMQSYFKGNFNAFTAFLILLDNNMAIFFKKSGQY